ARVELLDLVDHGIEFSHAEDRAQQARIHFDLGHRPHGDVIPDQGTADVDRRVRLGVATQLTIHRQGLYPYIAGRPARPGPGIEHGAFLNLDPRDAVTGTQIGLALGLDSVFQPVDIVDLAAIGIERAEAD